MPKGSTYGVIGRNGSGKSTALKLVAGITKPTSGTVKVQGRISALIELGAGFHPEISGRENVFINGIMLGLTKREIEKRFDEIVDFAELARVHRRAGEDLLVGHVHAPRVSRWRSTSIPTCCWSTKCSRSATRASRTSASTSSPSSAAATRPSCWSRTRSSLVERFCDEAVWIDHGRVMGHGDPKRIIDAYLTAVEKGEETLLATTTAKAVEAASRRDGDPPHPNEGVAPGNRSGRHVR